MDKDPRRQKVRISIDDTAAILDLLRQGKVGEVVDHVYKDLERIVRAVCREKGIYNKEDIEDITVETGIDLVKALPSFRGECKLSSLVRKIAKNNVDDWLRKKLRRLPSAGGSNIDEGDDDSSPLLDQEDKGITAPANRLCAQHAVEELQNQHPKWYDLMSEHLVMGLSAEEIAEAMRRSWGAVRTEIWQIRQELARLCEKHCGSKNCVLA